MTASADRPFPNPEALTHPSRVMQHLCMRCPPDLSDNSPYSQWTRDRASPVCQQGGQQ
jgi:hypothetical protein